MAYQRGKSSRYYAYKKKNFGTHKCCSDVIKARYRVFQYVCTCSDYRRFEFRQIVGVSDGKLRITVKYECNLRISRETLLHLLADLMLAVHLN